jgi:hypothetical protein
MSVIQHETVVSFDDLEPEAQAAELALLLDRMTPEAAQQVGQKVSVRGRGTLAEIFEGMPNRSRNAAAITAISILGGLTAAGMGLGAAAMFAGFDSGLLFGFAAAALALMGVMVVPMPVALKKLRRTV